MLIFSESLSSIQNQDLPSLTDVLPSNQTDSELYIASDNIIKPIRTEIVEPLPENTKTVVKPKPVPVEEKLPILEVSSRRVEEVQEVKIPLVGEVKGSTVQKIKPPSDQKDVKSLLVQEFGGVISPLNQEIKNSLSAENTLSQDFKNSLDREDKNTIAGKTKSKPEVEIKLTPKETSVLSSDVLEGQKNEIYIAKEVVEEESEANEIETDWQYQLPSPPTAFRDSTSPSYYGNDSEEAFKGDSVVTNPALFEKLKLVENKRTTEESRSEKTEVDRSPLEEKQIKKPKAEGENQDFAKDFLIGQNNLSQEEDKEILNKLSLEHLEKRKSLVYNRELSTSLKTARGLTDNKSSAEDFLHTKHSVVLGELEGVITNTKTKTISRSTSRVENTVQDSALPNFKITTYDNPKKKINIFEDDTVRSNTDKIIGAADSASNLTKNSSSISQKEFHEVFTLKRNSLNGRSMENISYRHSSYEDSFRNSFESNLRNDFESNPTINKNLFENGNDNKDLFFFKKPSEYGMYKSRSEFIGRSQDSTAISRSDSFSTNYVRSSWSPSNPVKRSQSQLVLNKRTFGESRGFEMHEELMKSNSLFDVSGLQSLEVICNFII